MVVAHQRAFTHHDDDDDDDDDERGKKKRERDPYRFEVCTPHQSRSSTHKKKRADVDGLFGLSVVYNQSICTINI